MSEVCSRLGLPHQYWPQGNCQYCGEIAPALAAKEVELERMRDALKQIAGEIGQFGFPWPETHVDYPAFALLTARAALKQDNK